jgi:hypothetical protein
MLHPTDYELAVNYFLEEFAGDVRSREVRNRNKCRTYWGADHRRLQRHGRYLSGTESGVRGSVTAGRYSATNVRVHHPRSPGFVK